MKEKISKIISKKEINALKKTISKNKPIIFLVAVFILTIAGSTIAFYYSKHVQENDFQLADYGVTLEEYFPVSEWDEDNILDKKVTITNSGNSDVLLRIAYNEIWYNGDNIVNNLYNGSPIVEKKWSQSFINDFVYSDGWYYYNKLLSKDESVVILESIEKVLDIYNESTDYYELDFNYEVVQSSNDASKYVWGKTSTIEGSNVTWEL